MKRIMRFLKKSLDRTLSINNRMCPTGVIPIRN